jgi:SAM-dependent methyltransferase
MRLSTLIALLNPKSIRRHSTGFCPVCSHKTLFLITDKLELIRNHAVCIRCHSVSRHRGVALCVLRTFSEMGITRLSDFARLPDIKVLNTSASSPISRALGHASNILNTEYFDDCASGQSRNGIPCQNLENLALDSCALDLVITEDVFEHVKDIEKGFSEVHRVLNKGGYHIFTIPFFFAQPTRHLFEKKADAYVPIVLPIEYHGDGVRGTIPAYHHIGYDMFDMLRKIGFDTAVHFSEFHEYKKYGTYNCFTFISKKL